MTRKRPTKSLRTAVSKGQETPKPAVRTRVGPNEQQVRAFVDVYSKTFNASKAALAAGYSLANSGAAGSAMLQNGRVQEALAAVAMDAQAEAGVRVVDILKHLMDIAYSNIADVLEAGATPVRVAKNGDATHFEMPLTRFLALPRNVTKAVASVKVTTRNLVAGDGINDRVVEFKMKDDVRALEILAKHKGILKEVVEHQLIIAQVEKMTDEELAVQHQRDIAQWEQQRALRARIRTSAAQLPPATLVVKKEARP